LILGVYRTRQEVRAKIEQRLDVRLNEGMLEEVQRLHDNGTKWERLESFGLEYRYAAQHLQGKISFGEMRSTLLAKICQFAKRQDSWFRKMEREGYRIFWFRPEETDCAFSLCQKFLHGQQLPDPAMKLSETLYGKQTTKGKNS